MTWGEWVDSEYNVINARIYMLSNGVGYISVSGQGGNTSFLYDSNYNHVITTQEIIANDNYITTSGGAGA